jgi:hypothetical protein
MLIAVLMLVRVQHSTLVDAFTGQFANSRNRGVASLTHYVCRTETLASAMRSAWH